MLQRVAASGLEHRHRRFPTHSLYACVNANETYQESSVTFKVSCIPHSPGSMHSFCILQETSATDFLIASGSAPASAWMKPTSSWRALAWWEQARKAREARPPVWTHQAWIAWYRLALTSEAHALAPLRPPAGHLQSTSASVATSTPVRQSAWSASCKGTMLLLAKSGSSFAAIVPRRATQSVLAATLLPWTAHMHYVSPCFDLRCLPVSCHKAACWLHLRRLSMDVATAHATAGSNLWLGSVSQPASCLLASRRPSALQWIHWCSWGIPAEAARRCPESGSFPVLRARRHHWMEDFGPLVPAKSYTCFPARLAAGDRFLWAQAAADPAHDCWCAETSPRRAKPSHVKITFLFSVFASAMCQPSARPYSQAIKLLKAWGLLGMRTTLLCLHSTQTPLGSRVSSRLLWQCLICAPATALSWTCKWQRCTCALLAVCWRSISTFGKLGEARVTSRCLRRGCLEIIYGI